LLLLLVLVVVPRQLLLLLLLLPAPASQPQSCYQATPDAAAQSAVQLLPSAAALAGSCAERGSSTATGLPVLLLLALLGCAQA
jgi:hypothetical protein